MDIDTVQNSVADISVPQKTSEDKTMKIETDDKKQDQPVNALKEVKKPLQAPSQTNRSDDLFAEAPYKDNEASKVKKPIEYKQASEENSEKDEGIEKLVGHVTFDDQTFGNNDSMDIKKGGVSFDNSIDNTQKRKIKNY